MLEQGFLKELGEKIEQGIAILRIYNDPEIYELERKRIFARAYIFVAHESEIPQPGDYVVRYVGDESYIVIRGEDGRIRALFNACRHRGMRLCRSEKGQAKTFLCPYHGWTYRNTGELIGVPAEKEAYGGRLDKAKWGLYEAPHVESYNGLIFVSLDPRAPSLKEYLGGMTWYLDLLTRRSSAGLEVIGAPQRWVVDVNWKLPAENFSSDAYHTLMTHRSLVQLGMAPSDPQFAMYGTHISAGNGHALGIGFIPEHLPLPPFLGYPEPVINALKRNYPSEAQVQVAEKMQFWHGTVFPNLSLLNAALPIPFLTFRVWRPMGPNRTEIWSWFLVERDAPEDFKRRSYETYVHTFGTSGVFEQDDVEIWRGITAMAGGPTAERFELNFQLGMHFQPDPTWPGPGTALPLDYAERNERVWLREWYRYLVSENPWQ
ncbi:3-phenylpropionate/cinnamic acid dioxygenase subunit alpha [bacterium HR08]|nr:3-phenylpropionate/cinnamic acid dioxygenase subunit alpha [bacterium HR08]